MTLSELAGALGLEVLHAGRGFDSAAVAHVVACDLMSDVLVADRHGHLLVTSLASDQAARTADIVGAAGVLVVNGKTLPATLVTVARDLDLTLLRGAEPKYETCVRLGRLLDA